MRQTWQNPVKDDENRVKFDEYSETHKNLVNIQMSLHNAVNSKKIKWKLGEVGYEPDKSGPSRILSGANANRWSRFWWKVRQSGRPGIGWYTRTTRRPRALIKMHQQLIIRRSGCIWSDLESRAAETDGRSQNNETKSKQMKRTNGKRRERERERERERNAAAQGNAVDLPSVPVSASVGDLFRTCICYLVDLSIFGSFFCRPHTLSFSMSYISALFIKFQILIVFQWIFMDFFVCWFFSIFCSWSPLIMVMARQNDASMVMMMKISSEMSGGNYPVDLQSH